MTCKNEDDFWNTSISSTFNFDDDEEFDNPEPAFTIPIKESSLPIDLVISKDNLNKLLSNVKSLEIEVGPPVEETVRKLLMGQKYNIYVYNTLEQKLLLLDNAIETWDGNVILNVIVFMKRTLKTNIFYYQLSKRKCAMRHYANYLTSKNHFQDLADLYMATGNIHKMKSIYYLLNKDISNQRSLFKRLQQLIIEHFQNITAEEKRDLDENMEFIKWQIDRSLTADSVIEQLAIICKTKWEHNLGDELITEFKKQFRIYDFQFEWVVMNTLCFLKLWDKLISTFIRPNWLTKKVALKSVIRPDLFLIGLSKHKPSTDILDQFLQCITDTEKNLELAVKLNLHKSVIKHYIYQKDKIALQNYKQKLTSQSEEYLIIENALVSTDKKWKN